MAHKSTTPTKPLDPRLLPLLDRHNLTPAQYQRQGRLPKGDGWILDRRRALVTELHAAGTSWADMIAITGLSHGSIQRLTEAMWNQASRKNVSDHAKRKIAKTGFQGRSEWVQTHKGGHILVRSSLERKAALKIDADPDVVRFDYERTLTGKTGEIHPDFIAEHIDGTFTLIEVKAAFFFEMKNQDRALRRIEAYRSIAEQQGWKFALWTEKEIGIPERRHTKPNTHQLPQGETPHPIRIS